MKFNKIITVPDSYLSIEHYQMSDTHLEDITKDFRNGEEDEFLSRIPFPKPEAKDTYNVLLLLGDVMEFKKSFLPSLVLKHICDYFDLVIYVPGNHCYYNSSIASVEARVRGFMKDIPNFILLQNETLTLDYNEKRINYIGSTLWTDFGRDNVLFNEAGGKIDNYTYAFSDYKKIAVTSKPYVNLKPAHVLSMHNASVSYIESELKRCKGDTNIVLSHHAPTYKSATHFANNRQGRKLKSMMRNHLKTKDVFKQKSLQKWEKENLDRYTPLFCNNLDYLIKSYKPLFWGHGHVHERRLYKLHQSIISCNPTGYLCEQINTRMRTKPTFNSVLSIKPENKSSFR